MEKITALVLALAKTAGTEFKHVGYDGANGAITVPL